MSEEHFSAVRGTVAEQMRQGIILARAGDRSGAEAIFDAILEQRPDYEEALVWKAAIVRDPDEAVNCLEKALQVNPANRRARIGLEWAYKRQKESQDRAPNLDPFENPKLATLSDDTPAHFSPTRRRFSEPEEPEQLRLDPPQPAQSKPPDNKPTNSETIKQVAPYKKRRLENAEQVGPSFHLPSEAVDWTRPGPRQTQSNRRQTSPKTAVENSSVFRAASPKVAFSVSPKVKSARRGRFNSEVEQTFYPLRWPLGLFGIALGLALLTFPLSGAAPVFGSIAFLLSLIGVYLFNRARL
jgi:tetratricopeptide (TPR) repeat protein